MKRLVSTAVAAVVVVGALVLPSSAHSASQDTRGSDVPAVLKANPGLSSEMLASLPQAVLDSDVYIDESYVAGTPIVYPDGTPVPGQTLSPAAIAAFCGGTVFGPGVPVLAWGPESLGNCGVFGSPGWYQGYLFGAATGVYTTGCVQGKGFNSSHVKTWYGIACGTSGSNSVPWGNVLATPSTRATSTASPAGFTANWSS